MSQVSFMRFNLGSDGFTHNYLPTIGANLEKKTLEYKDYRINICIWDTAGQEKYFSLTKGIDEQKMTEFPLLNRLFLES